MRKHRWAALFLAILLFTAAAVPAAAGDFEEEDLDFDDLMEIKEDLLWTFPVALEDMKPEYIILANKHYLLPKDYVPENLVKVPLCMWRIRSRRWIHDVTEETL